MRCDIIVPIYNNASVLTRTLPALRQQEVLPGWEVGLILSDDGSSDGTIGVAHNQCRQYNWPCRILNNSHTGAAGARNRAVAVSAADIVLFLGADIVLRPGALAAHLRWHQSHHENNQAALGFVLWDPEINPTPLMEWMTHGGSQNDYDAVLGVKTADPRHFFYGSNLSLRRDILGEKPFPEKYKNYGWEDLDLGYLLAEKFDLKLRVLPDAIGHHYHYYSAKQALTREYLVGGGYVSFIELHPEARSKNAGRIGHYIKHMAVKWCGLLVVLKWLVGVFDSRWSMPRLFRWAMSAVFWQGFYSTYPHKSKGYPHSYPQ